MIKMGEHAVAALRLEYAVADGPRPTEWAGQLTMICIGLFIHLRGSIDENCESKNSESDREQWSEVEGYDVEGRAMFGISGILKAARCTGKLSVGFRCMR